jgi:hypothetical protein
LVAVLGSSALVGWTCERADGGRGFAGPFSLEIEFQGLHGTDPSAAIIDRGVAQSYCFMQHLNLVGPPGATA